MIKKLSRLSLIALMAAAFFASCAKPASPDPAPVNNTPALKATIDGTAFAATTVSAQMNQGLVNIGGPDASNNSIVLMFPSKSPGTYTLTSSGGTNEGAIICSKNGTSYYSSSGSIVVTSYANSIIKGTFQGIVESMSGGKSTITNGTFTANLP
jgi:hypothetical protein